MSSVSTDYLRDLGGNVTGDWNGSGWVTLYFYMGSLLGEYTLGTTYFRFQDHLGSTRLVTNVSGTPVDSMDYFPFGEQIAGGSATNYKFTGDERDSGTGLDRTDFRQYASRSGRWTTPDPGGLAIVDQTNPQSWNAYTYVFNNPINFVDPSGLYCRVHGIDENGLEYTATLDSCNEDDCKKMGSYCTWIQDGGPIPDPGGGIAILVYPDGSGGDGGLPVGGCASYYVNGVYSGNICNGPTPDANGSWWRTFGRAFVRNVLTGAREPGQSFSACVNQNIRNTTLGTVNPQKLAAAIPAVAVGLAGALIGKVPFKIPFDPGTGGLTAFTASAYGLGRVLGASEVGMGALIGSANGVGYGLAIAGAAITGLVLGSAINCR